MQNLLANFNSKAYNVDNLLPAVLPVLLRRLKLLELVYQLQKGRFFDLYTESMVKLFTAILPGCLVKELEHPQKLIIRYLQ
jgi:hypothetical protein